MNNQMAAQQPGWVCEECGNRYKAGKWKQYSTWHYGKCDVCQQPKSVTEPRDCGYLKKEWAKHCHG